MIRCICDISMLKFQPSLLSNIVSMDGPLVSDDEFHETFEDITSASSSESADEGSRRNMRTHGGKVAHSNGLDKPPVWSSSSYLNSKFSVWKNDPGSINDRRQRFFKQMGIRNLREEPNFGHGTPDMSRSLFVTAAEKCEKKAGESGKHATDEDSTSPNEQAACQACGGESDSPQICEHLQDFELDTEQRTDVERRTVSGHTENGGKNNEGPSRLVGFTSKSGTQMLAETSGAVLRVGKSKSGPLLPASSGSNDLSKKSRSGLVKSRERQSLVDGAGVLGSHKSTINSPQVSPNEEVLSKVQASPEESLSPLWNDSTRIAAGNQHQASSSQEKLSQSCDTDFGYETTSQDGHSAPEDNSKEDDLKIRDLDSGKEFVVNRFNIDGTLNMLREVDTGKELTLAEFEKSLGLSPIAQELRRRQQDAQNQVSNEKPRPDSTSGTGALKKKKSWLKNLKGSLTVRSSKEKPLNGLSSRSDKHSGDETDGSDRISRDGSSKGGHSREGSFTGYDRDDSSKGVLRSGSVDENTGLPWRQPQKVKVKLRRKSFKELSELHIGQEIQAHYGAIWTMKFSPDGRYLASAGQDRVVHVWEVLDHPSVAEPDLWGGLENGTPDMGLQQEDSRKAGQDSSSARAGQEGSTKGGKATGFYRRKSSIKGPVPKLFWLSEKPMCSFRGHTEDILDLSWSRTQFLLSSSMDKTVRLWHISYEECLRIFSHNDYVTCVEFNPIDDRYFLSGALDDKVRIWSIPDHQVVDWSDLREMVTAVCYTPDGKKAIVGSYKGTCRFYNTIGNKLQLDGHINVRTENKKGRGKKITGLHCMPGDSRKVLVTSNDSRIRVYDGLELHAKYKGLRNVNSQISASYSPNGDFIISASEDSKVFVWNSGNHSTGSTKSLYRRDKQQSCEEFYSRHVSVAILWPESSSRPSHAALGSETAGKPDKIGSARVASEPELPPSVEETRLFEGEHSENHSKCPSSCLGRSPLGLFGSGKKNDVTVADESTIAKQIDIGTGEIQGIQPNVLPSATSLVPSTTSALSGTCEDSPPPHLQRCPSFFPDSGPKGSATWPEEKLPSFGSRLASGSELAPTVSEGNNMSGRLVMEASAVVDDPPAVPASWGLVIVTAGLGGEITSYQNYGLPVRL